MTNSCPKCSAVGRRVRDTTIRAILKPDTNTQLVDSRFCRTRECPGRFALRPSNGSVIPSPVFLVIRALGEQSVIQARPVFRR